MSQLTRELQKVYGDSVSATGNFGIFGSLAAGSPAYSKDPAAIQSLTAFMQGWSTATVGTKSPALEDMNSLFFLLFRQVAYMLQSGVPEWHVGETYYINQFCRSGSTVYVSLVDNNIGNAVTNGNYWQNYIDLSIPAKSRCKAWVTFVGDGLVGANCTLLDFYGVTSVLKQADGVYLITFSTAFANAYYVWSGSASSNSGTASNGNDNFLSGGGDVASGLAAYKSTTQLRVVSMSPMSDGGADPESSQIICVQLFGA